MQEGEAGGITQQIGATHFPQETLAIQTNRMQAKNPFEIKLPGLLVSLCFHLTTGCIIVYFPIGN